MTTRIVRVAKYISIFLFLLFGLIACEKDFKDIGVSLVNNNKFNTNLLTSNVIAYTQNIDSSRVDSVPQLILGVYNSSQFGKTTANIASSLALPSTGIDFGTNAKIDSVILDIPYYAKKLGNQTIKDPNSNVNTDSISVPNYQLDSIIGNKDVAFQIKVYELGTFLNKLDPENPTKLKKYYSNKKLDSVSPPLYVGNFKPSATDTVSYIKRYNTDGTVYNIDTIKGRNASPSIKLPLNESIIKSKFLDKGNGIFQNSDDFLHYFRGLYIQATGNNGSLINLPTNGSSMRIYLSNDVTTTDSTGVSTTARHSETLIFALAGVKVNQYIHDYSTATSQIANQLVNPDKINGESKLYLQGASGSQVILNILSQEDLAAIRSQNWLINEANIYLYVDKNVSNNDVPHELFLYNYDNNEHILDFKTEGLKSLGGNLTLDSDGKPDYYKFNITDYISHIVQPDNTENVVKLGVKSFVQYDLPNQFFPSDTLIKNFNWNPKEVVLVGNKDASNRKLKLQIYYTKEK